MSVCVCVPFGTCQHRAAQQHQQRRNNDGDGDDDDDDKKIRAIPMNILMRCVQRVCVCNASCCNITTGVTERIDSTKRIA